VFSVILEVICVVQGRIQGGRAPGARPPKIGKNMIFWCKIVIIHTKYPIKFSRLPPLGAIFLSAHPLTWNPGSAPVVLSTPIKKQYWKSPHFINCRPFTFWHYVLLVFFYFSINGENDLEKSLQIPKGQSEAITRRRTDNTMTKRKGTKGQTMIYKALHMKR
jgi:hypothetical protein